MYRMGFGCSLAATAIVALSAPAFGATRPNSSSWAVTEASWDYGCAIVLVSSDKDISNVVYRIDGTDVKIEFNDGITSVVLPGTATDVWIKSGSFRSDDGSGYGSHHQRPQSCDTTTQPFFEFDSAPL